MSAAEISCGLASLLRSKLAAKLATYRIRTCHTMHECAICGETIGPGHRYHDGGHGRRAHTSCAAEHVS